MPVHCETNSTSIVYCCMSSPSSCRGPGHVDVNLIIPNHPRCRADTVCSVPIARSWVDSASGNMADCTYAAVRNIFLLKKCHYKPDNKKPYGSHLVDNSWGKTYKGWPTSIEIHMGYKRNNLRSPHLHSMRHILALANKVPWYATYAHMLCFAWYHTATTWWRGAETACQCLRGQLLRRHQRAPVNSEKPAIQQTAHQLWSDLHDLLFRTWLDQHEHKVGRFALCQPGIYKDKNNIFSTFVAFTLPTQFNWSSVFVLLY